MICVACPKRGRHQPAERSALASARVLEARVANDRAQFTTSGVAAPIVVIDASLAWKYYVPKDLRGYSTLVVDERSKLLLLKRYMPRTRCCGTKGTGCAVASYINFMRPEVKPDEGKLKVRPVEKPLMWTSTANLSGVACKSKIL
jgi:hypothetical protein